MQKKNKRTNKMFLESRMLFHLNKYHGRYLKKYLKIYSGRNYLKYYKKFKNNNNFFIYSGVLNLLEIYQQEVFSLI